MTVPLMSCRPGPVALSMRALSLIYTLSCVLTSTCDAVLPFGQVGLQLHRTIKPQFTDLLASPSASAGWGVPLPEIQNSRWKHIHMQALDASNAEGCLPYTLPSFAPPMELHVDPYTTLVVVDRGNCSFVHKTNLAMAAGARGLVVRGTRKAVYDSILSQNKTNTTSTVTDSGIDPKAPVFEYDCAHGEAFVAFRANPVWETDEPRCSYNKQCKSKMCVLTDKEDASRGGFQLCCLWDTHILMGGGNRTLTKNITVPVVYMTISDGKQLERSWTKYPALLIRTYARREPFLDVASLLLWLLGVSTAIGAAYYSAAQDREAYWCRTDPNYYARKQQQRLEDGANGGNHRQDDQEQEQEMTWEIDGRTAVAFIACAALFLTIFYFVKIAAFLPVLFALSATGTLTQLVTAPLLSACGPPITSRQFFIPVVNETWPLAEILGVLWSGSLAIVWFIYRRTAWYLQDLFGVSLCFVFLRTVQLPNLKVATILLSLAFCYDVFFVFLSPLVFGSSVMEDVATGGPAAYTHSGYPGIDYCERYPEYTPCLDPEPMPMLLVLPRVLNWLGGVSMLGLGDIILPGLLLSYALRFDYSPQSLGENYFRSVCIGYAIGLGMANLAVTITQVGQPALMYLVPTCLGTLHVRAKWNGDWKAMWLGLGTKDKDDEDEDKRSGEHESENGRPSTRGATASEQSPRAAAALNDGPHDHAPLLGGSSSN